MGGLCEEKSREDTIAPLPAISRQAFKKNMKSKWAGTGRAGRDPGFEMIRAQRESAPQSLRIPPAITSASAC